MTKLLKCTTLLIVIGVIIVLADLSYFQSETVQVHKRYVDSSNFSSKNDLTPKTVKESEVHKGNLSSKRENCAVKPIRNISQPNSSGCQLNAKNLTIYMDSFRWLEDNFFLGPYTEYLKASRNCSLLPGGGTCRYDIKDKCADGILFYSAHSDLKFAKQHPHQIIISFTTDPKGNPTRRFPPDFVEDVKVTYERTSNVPRLYMCENDRALKLYNMGQPELPRDKKGVLGMISNCRAKWRNEYIKELMKHITISQVGKCYHNSQTKMTRFLSNWDDVKLDFLRKSQYKYILAFENNIEPDYVTEKVFHGLLTGLIPIYYGDRSVFYYIPGNHTIIYAPDYTPKQLAEHIKQIDSDEKLYASFFKDWDLKKISTIHEQYCSDHFMCRICRKVLEVRYHQEGCTNVKLMDKGDH